MFHEKLKADYLFNLQNMCFILLIGCLFSDLYMSYFDIGPYSLRNYLAVAALGILFWKFITDRRSVSSLKIPVALKCLLALWCVFILTSGLDLAENVRFFLKRLLMPAIIFVFTYYTLKDQPGLLRKFLFFFVVLITISTFIAVMQWFEVDFFWKLRSVMPESGTNADKFVAVRHRAIGMAYFFIPMGYQLSMAFPLALYLYYKTKTKFFLLCSAILFIGAFAVEAKSSVIAVCVSLLIMHRSKKIAVLLIILAFAGIYVKENFSAISYSISTELKIPSQEPQEQLKPVGSSLNIRKSTTYARPLFIYNGLVYLVHTPLGNGKWDAYHKFTRNHNSKIFNFKGGQAVKIHAPHNEFLNTGILFGWPGLIILLYMYYRLIKDTSKLVIGSDPKKDTKLNMLLFKAVIVVIIAYVCNSFFHNNGPFMGHPLPWYFYGFLYAVLDSNQIPETLQVNSTDE